MKKRVLLFTLTAGLMYVTLQSNNGGASTNMAAGNRTGSSGGTSNCGGGGCHGGESATVTANIRVDSVGGVEVTKYVAGMTYTVTVTGSHATLSHFGFQFAAVSGTGTTQAGTFGTAPAQVANRTVSGINIMEQTTKIVGPLSKQFTWTAPATGVGTISMHLTVNGVNNDGGATSSDLSHHVSKTFTQYIPASVTNVANKVTVAAFPNPATNNLNIQVGNAHSNYSLQVYDVAGRSIMNSQIVANGTGVTNINTSGWASGIYQVVVADESSREVIQVVKQ